MKRAELKEAEAKGRPSIPIYRDELIKLREAASAMDILEICAHEGINASIDNFEWLTRKMQPLWDLAMDEFDIRWRETHGDELPRFNED
jgi:hypothetical protein